MRDLELLESSKLDNGWTMIRIGNPLKSGPHIEMWCHDNCEDKFVLKENILFVRSESDAALLKLTMKASPVPPPLNRKKIKTALQAFRSVR